MDMLRATLRLYATAGQSTASALPRSLWATAFLLGAFLATVVLGGLLAPMGMAGGFVLGFIHAALIGWYLALLQIVVSSRRRIKLQDVREHMGTYLWEVISILFIFWIASMVLELTVPTAMLVVVPIANLLFNPAPEMIYQDRTQSLDLLKRAVTFMQHNWPEWLGAHAVAWGALAAWAWALNGSLSEALVLRLARLFGPFFEFLSGGVLMLSLDPGLPGLLSFLGMFAFAHAFMVFRGFLYKELAGSSRRGRAWRARM